MWTAHRVFVIHLSGMQGHRGAYLGLMVCASSGLTPVQVPAESKHSKPWWSHEVTQKHCRDRGWKRNCLSVSASPVESLERSLKMFPVLNCLFSYWFKDWILRDQNIGVFQISQGKQRGKNTQASLLYIMVFIIYLLCGFLFFLMSSGYMGALGLQVPWVITIYLHICRKVTFL